MKSSATHITNQKLSFDIFTIGNLQNMFMEDDLYLISPFFGIKKIYNFNPYDVLLTIAKNIPVLFMTGFWSSITFFCFILTINLSTEIILSDLFANLTWFV